MIMVCGVNLFIYLSNTRNVMNINSEENENKLKIVF